MAKTLIAFFSRDTISQARSSFLSTKLWPSEYENPDAVDETLERLGVDYVDLLYIHQPAGNWLAGYRQLEKAYKEGKAKSIGISNFEGKYIEELQTKWEIVPQFIQVEAHPYFTQQDPRADNPPLAHTDGICCNPGKQEYRSHKGQSEYLGLHSYRRRDG